MELNELEQSVKNLNAVLNEFPIGAVSLDDFKPVEKKIQEARESLMRMNARLLMLRAKCKQYDHRQKQNEEEIEGVLQDVTSDTLINAKAIKLCLHSTTITSILNNKEGNTKDQKKLYTYMGKLFTLNDRIMTIQEEIEKAFKVQLDLKIECQKKLYDHKNFLKEQEEIQSKRLQETYPEIVQTKDKLEKTIRKINVLKKLIRNFIAASGHILAEEPIFIKMLERHRELISLETIVKMSQK